MTPHHESLVYRRSVSPNDFGVEFPARFDRPFLRFVVDVHDPEAARVSVAPLEIVQQGPHVIAAQACSLAYCFASSIQVLTQVGHSQRIVDSSVEWRGWILKCRPVLRDIEWDVAVALVDPEQHSRERRRMHLPAGLGVNALDLWNSTSAHRWPFRIVTADAPRVVVHSKEIQRLRDGLHVVFRKIGPGLAEYLFHLFGISPEEHRVEILPVPIRIRTIRRRDILGAIRSRILRLEIYDETNPPTLRRITGPKRLHRRSMRSQQIVRRNRRLEQIPVTGSELTIEIASIAHHPWLVYRAPHRDPITKRFEHDRCVVAEPAGDVTIQPAAAIIQCRRQVPVIKRRVRLDAARKERIDETRIEIDSLPVHSAESVPKYPAPRDAESVGIEAEAGHQRNVSFVTAIVIAGDVPGVSVFSQPRRMGETMPDAGSRSISERRPFDLIRRRGCSPHKIKIGRASCRE